MSLLLIVPPKQTAYGPPAMPRLGLAYLSAALKNQAVEHRIIDLNFFVQGWEEVLEQKIPFFTSFGLTATSYEFSAAARVAEFVKKHSQAPIILGGPHATLLGTKILEQFQAFDYVFMGEAEQSLPVLIHSLSGPGPGSCYRDLAGLCFRHNGQVRENGCARIAELDSLGFPSYEQFDLAAYAESPGNMLVQTSRGCPYGCIYCSVGLVMGKKIRPRSSQSVVSEIQHLVETYDTRMFSFADDNFTFDMERAKEVCRRIISSGLGIRWNASNGLRADRLDEELVGLMKASGCSEVALGIESTNNEVLKNLGKKTTIQTIHRAIDLLQKHGIPMKGFFLVGSPGETRQDVYDSLEFAKKHLSDARFSLLTPYPGTKLWDWVEQNDLWTVDHPMEALSSHTHTGVARTMFATPEFGQLEKEAVCRDVWHNWEAHSSDKSLKGRLKGLLQKHPRLYDLARRLYRKGRAVIKK